MIQRLISKANQALKSKAFWSMTCFMVTVLSALFYFQPGVGYEIVSNGHHVGYARTKHEAELAVSNMKESILQEKGEDASFDFEVSFIKGKIGNHSYTSAEVMQYNFENSLDIKIPAYAIKKNNEFVMAVSSEEDAQKVLDTVQEPYKKESSDTVSNVRVSFVQEVAIVKLDHVSEAKVLPLNEALAAVNPSTAVSRSNTSRTLSTGAPASKTTLFDVKTVYEEFSTVPVAPGVKKVPNSDLYVGETKLLSEGKPGVREVLSQITQVNGVNVEKKTLAQEVTQKPVDKVVYYGTKVKKVTTKGQIVLSGDASGVASIALRYIGTPYVYGGASPSGFDCSGFTQYVYRQVGISLPRTSGAQSKSGQYVSLSNLKSGDLLYGPGHVGIYIGNGQYVHAPVPGQSVRVQSISTFPRLSHGVRLIG